MTTLARLARSRSSDERPRLLSTTVNAVAAARAAARAHRGGNASPPRPATWSTWTPLVAWLEMNGFLRTGTVRDTGEYAVRGGIVDLYRARPAEPGAARLLRRHARIDPLLRSGDAAHGRPAARARSRADERGAAHDREHPPLPPELRGRAFGAPTRDDRLYEAVSEGRRYPGIEHWLPLFHDRLDTLLDYAPGVPVVFDALVDDAAGERLAQVKDYYDARKTAVAQPQAGVAPYRPLPPERALPEAGGMGRAHGRARRRPSHALRHPGVSRAPRRRLRGAARAQLHRRAGGGGHQRLRRRRAARARPAGGRASASSSARGRKARASASAMCSPTTA